MTLYGIIEFSLRKELQNVKSINSYLNDSGVIVEFQDGSTKWYEYIEVVNYE